MNPNQEQEKKPLEQYVRHNELSKFLVFFGLFIVISRELISLQWLNKENLVCVTITKTVHVDKNVLEISNRNFNI
jgi:hypothetical protein